MRKILTVIAVMALPVIAASGQTAREQIAMNPLKAGGVYYMYEFKEHVVTAPPKGYEPVYLSHYGRHGARYLMYDTNYLRSLDVLAAAHEKGALTPDGERLWQEASAYYETECKYREGDLTTLGWEQHYKIAQEIFKDNRKFFKKHPSVTAGATQVPRCIVSMAAFCQGLANADHSLKVYENASRADLDALNPHAEENPYREVEILPGKYARKDPWGTGLKEFIDERLDHRAICGRFFLDPDFPKSFRGTRAFVTELYDIVFDMQCTPTSRSLMWVFTADEYYSLWEINNYTHYMTSAPAATMRDLPALLALVDDADRALAAGEPAVRLRFGHDTVFLWLLSAIGADCFDTVPTSADGISSTWFNFRSPMAATLYLLFCKNRGGDVIFKLVVNGDEAILPLESFSGPWYRWNDFKSILSSRYSR